MDPKVNVTIKFQTVIDDDLLEALGDVGVEMTKAEKIESLQGAIQGGVLSWDSLLDNAVGIEATVEEA